MPYLDGSFTTTSLDVWYGEAVGEGYILSSYLRCVGLVTVWSERSINPASHPPSRQTSRDKKHMDNERLHAQPQSTRVYKAVDIFSIPTLKLYVIWTVSIEHLVPHQQAS